MKNVTPDRGDSAGERFSLSVAASWLFLACQYNDGQECPSYVFTVGKLKQVLLGDSPRLWHGTGRYRVAADLINKSVSEGALSEAKSLERGFRLYQLAWDDPHGNFRQIGIAFFSIDVRQYPKRYDERLLAESFRPLSPAPSARTFPKKNMSFLSRIRSAGNQQIDNTFLVYFRIAFGFIVAWGMMKYFHHDLIWTCFQEPRLLFTYRGFDFVKPLPGCGLHVLFLVIAISATCIALGFRYRLMATVFFLSFTYMFLLDQSWYLNHFYLICLLGFLLQFIPAGQAFSIDALRSKEIRSDTTPRWGLWLLRLQIGIPYFYGGLAKLNPDWLTGEPMRTWLAARTDIWLIGPFFQEEWCVYAFSYGGLLYDLLVIPLLLWKRTRIPALIVSVMFHVGNHFLFTIGIFPWLMLAATFLLFPPFELSRLRFWKTTARTESESQTVFQLPSFGKWILYGFLTVQLLLPFRHFLYPGDVAFSREGHCFSWRMKLNIRKVDLKLFVHHADGRVAPVNMHEWVTLAQDKGFRNLDQVQQLARAIGKHHEAIDKQPVQVKGTAIVTVNRRAPFNLIRDEVDLSRTPRTLLPADWIKTRHDSQEMKENESNLVPAKPVPSTAAISTNVVSGNVLAHSNGEGNR